MSSNKTSMSTCVSILHLNKTEPAPSHTHAAWSFRRSCQEEGEVGAIRTRTHNRVQLIITSVSNSLKCIAISCRTEVPGPLSIAGHWWGAEQGEERVGGRQAGDTRGHGCSIFRTQGSALVSGRFPLPSPSQSARGRRFSFLKLKYSSFSTLC